MLRQPLASAFFLLVHDPFTGKLLISDELLACGVVGAQLGELMIGGRLLMVGGRITVLDARGNDTTTGASDTIRAYVVDSIRRQPEAHTVRTWTENLGPPLTELVARDVVASGLLRRQAGGGLLRRRADAFPAVDLVSAAAPKVRLEHALRVPQEMDLTLGFLAALVWALGVEPVLDPDLDRAAAREVVDEVFKYLPATLGELVEGIRSAVAAVSLRVRR